MPDVVQTAPRLPDGTPFPTLYYLTCPRASAAISRLEAAGLMREMTAPAAARMQSLRARYQAAHEDYLARRDEAARQAGLEPLPPGTQSAGGMPDRVKCLHALAAHALAVPGVNPLGDEAVEAAGRVVAGWTVRGPGGSRAGRSDGRRPEGGLMTKRVAAIDCGTNSLRLLIADVDPARHELTDVERQDGDRPARTGRRRHRDARGGGAGPHVRGAGRVRRATSAASTRPPCAWWRPAPPGTPAMPPTSPRRPADPRYRTRGHQRR